MSWSQRAYSCSEMHDVNLQPPKQLASVFQDPNIIIRDTHDALLCLLNVLVTEAGFVPCTFFSAWKKRFFYSIEYTHKTTGDIVCQLKYLPIEKSDEVHIFGTVQNKQVAKYTLKHNQFVGNIKEKDPRNVYKDVRTLSNVFKDRIVWKMLAAAQQLVNGNPRFGLTTLPVEVKLEILYKLEVRELGRLSCISKNFNEILEDTSFWKYIFGRDFPKNEEPEDQFKEVYKEKYLAKKKEEKLERENEKLRKTNRQIHLNELYKRNANALPRFTMPRFAPDPEAFFHHGPRPGPSRRQDMAFVNLNFF